MSLSREKANVGNWKVANGEVVIANGRIQGNPFARQMHSSMAVQWMLQNQERVTARIGAVLHAHGVQGGDCQDCFDFALEYFTDRDSRVFRKNFHGKGTGYSVGAYVMGNLNYIVETYRNKVVPKDVTVMPMIREDEAERNFAGKLGDAITKSTDKTPEAMLALRDVEYWDNYFEGVMDWFMEHVEAYSYTEFPYEKFVYSMFLHARSVDKREQLRSTAEICGMGKALSEYVLKNIDNDKNKNKPWVVPFVEGILELLEARKLGWKPKSIREGVEEA